MIFAVTGTGANGCPAGTTKLTWKPGPIAGGIARTLSYNVKVTEGAVGNVQYTNNATLEGSGLNDGANNPSVEYVVSKTATNTVTVNGVTIGKTGSTAEFAASFNTGTSVARVSQVTMDAAINTKVASLDNIGSVDVPVTGTFTATTGNPTSGQIAITVIYQQRADNGAQVPAATQN